MENISCAIPVHIDLFAMPANIDVFDDKANLMVKAI